MNWVKNKVRNWLKESTGDKIYEGECMPTKGYASVSGGYAQRLDSPGGINFRIHRANGGFIVETNLYDPTSDRNRSGLHIITNDQDMGQEIGKIITMECLKN